MMRVSFRYNHYFKSGKIVENIFASKNISKHGKEFFCLFSFGYVYVYFIRIYDNIPIRKTCMRATDASKTSMDLLREQKRNVPWFVWCSTSFVPCEKE